MAPEYDKLVELFKGSRDDIVVARIEGSINEDISNKYGVYSFPLVVLFKPNDLHVQGVFQGQRVAPVMKAWVEANAPLNKQEKPENNGKNENAEKPFEVGTYDKSQATPEMEFFGREIELLRSKIDNLEHEMEDMKNNYNNLQPTKVIINGKHSSGNAPQYGPQQLFTEKGFRFPSMVELITYASFLLILVALGLTVRRFLQMSQQSGLGMPLHSKV
jgi:hypothetical protein